MKTFPSLLCALGVLCELTTLTAQEANLRPAQGPDARRPNILFITVDDMSCDSVGAFGCGLQGITPHTDRLASQGLRFDYAHVQVGNCYPSRNVMFSGRYPHNSGVEGFYQVKPTDFPVLCDLMKAGGYYTAIRGKVSHSTPYQPYAWDDDLTVAPDGTKLHIKDVPSYGECTARGIANAKAAGKPFCLNINISDPHKPFWKPGDQQGRHKASRIFRAGEVPVPGFLFEDPAVREELALYYTSVRRADDAVGAILKALEESGQQDETVVVFLSDHGMPLPFAKTQLYHHSTRTPLIVKWPGVTKAGAVDKDHMVSAVDFLPTLLDIAGLDHPKGFDGRSFEPLLRGGRQEERGFVFKVYNENSGGNRHPIRGIETRHHLYLFNPWSDGKNVFRTATNGTATYRRMKQLAPERPDLAARLEVMDHRTVEELYDLRVDPDCLHNLIGDPKHEAVADGLRRTLGEVMEATNDHALEPFRKRDEPAALAAYMKKVQDASDERRARKRKGNRPAGQASASPGSGNYLKLQPPRSAAAGDAVTVTVPHDLPAALGTQQVHVTLKDGHGKRIERKVVKATGKSTLEIRFDLPATVPGDAISFAVFVGEDFEHHLQHLASKPVALN